jgi:hypothetical protein
VALAQLVHQPDSSAVLLRRDVARPRPTLSLRGPARAARSRAAHRDTPTRADQPSPRPRRTARRRSARAPARRARRPPRTHATPAKQPAPAQAPPRTWALRPVPPPLDRSPLAAVGSAPPPPLVRGSIA